MNKNDDKNPYDRLTRGMQKIVDQQVAAYGDLMQGYYQLIQDAEAGKPMSAEQIDALQQAAIKAGKVEDTKALRHEVLIGTAIKVRDKRDGIMDWVSYEVEEAREPYLDARNLEREKKIDAIFEREYNGEDIDADALIDKVEKESNSPGLLEMLHTGVVAATTALKEVEYQRFDVRLDIRDAIKQKAQEWDHAHPEVVEAVTTERFLRAIERAHAANGVSENTQLADGTNTREALFAQLLANNPGIAISDMHVFDDSFSLVERQMQTLKANGVDTIYVEFNKEGLGEYQALSLDELRKLSRTGAAGDIIHSDPEKWGLYYAADKSDDWKKGFTDMLIAAREQGVRVVGMDEKSFDNYAVHHWDRRLVVTNAVWADNIKKDREELREETGNADGKYVIIAGAAHFNYPKGRVDELLGIPTIALAKGRRDKQPAFERIDMPPQADFLVPGGPDYYDTKKDILSGKLDETGQAMQQRFPTSVANIAAMAAGGGMKYLAEQLRNEVQEDMNRKYTPEELEEGPYSPPQTPVVPAKGEQGKDR